MHLSKRLLAVATLLAAVALLTAADGGIARDASTAGDSARAVSSSAGGWEARPDHVREPVADGKAQELDDGGTVGADVPADAALEQQLSDFECEDGTALVFPCENVDLLSFVPNAELGGGNANDLWGWTDPETGREYAIVGTGYTTAFVDIDEPTDPQVVAWLPSESAQYIPLWRDIKVYDDHAFVVSEHTGHGMQVVDLTKLRDADPDAPTVLSPDAVYDGFSSAHNVAINPDSGYAYAVGTDTCDGGLHMVDIGEPTEPTQAGCFAADGYTHDVQCVNYGGPDEEHHDKEICFASNEDTVTIVDVTDKDNPQQLSRTGYDTAAYTHQGWLTPEQDWFLFGDELDESNGTVDKTTTYILDVSDLDDPPAPEPYTHETDAIDHNLYVEDEFVYQANYVAGLRVLTYDDAMLGNGQLDEIGYFDVAPHVDVPQYAGAWSNYPFYESGVVAVSGIETGLFVLEPDLPEQDGEEPDPGPGDPGQGDGRSDDPGQGEGRPDDPGDGNGRSGERSGGEENPGQGDGSR